MRACTRYSHASQRAAAALTWQLSSCSACAMHGHCSQPSSDDILNAHAALHSEGFRHHTPWGLINWTRGCLASCIRWGMHCWCRVRVIK